MNENAFHLISAVESTQNCFQLQGFHFWDHKIVHYKLLKCHYLSLFYNTTS